jgi:23S rRNA pseudouridine1911/1915/1917 synthase
MPRRAPTQAHRPATHTRLGALLASHEQQGQRLDAFVRERLPGHSRKAIADLFASARVRVNGRLARKGAMLAAGDRVEIDADSPAIGAGSGAAPDAALALPVLYEDAWLIAVDKPAGIASAALRRGETGSAASGLLARYPELRGVGYGPLEPGLLHRLDTDTSGVLLAARTQAAFLALCQQHDACEITKTYLALCHGLLAVPEPRTERAYLDASDRKRVRVRVLASEGQREVGKPIATQLVAAEPRGAFSLVTVRVQLAGRHQVRAHLAALGHPIVADELYGGERLLGLTRHFLHAASVQLAHPDTGRPLMLNAPLPADLAAALASCSAS